MAGVCALLLAWSGVARAQESVGARAVDVEAAYLVNFLRYTQWPAERTPARGAPLVITVVGDPAVADRVRAVAAAAGAVEGHPIEVRNLPWARGSLAIPLDSDRDRDVTRQMRESHLLYFSDSAAYLHPRVLADLYGHPVLTVGNAEGFARRGGMLGLLRRRGNIVFEANPGAIRSAGLVVSAKVLKLARPAR
jgi:hypothetical protein